MSPPARPPRVLVAKPGLDGHDRGAKAVAMALRDGGMEGIYTGLRRTVDQIVKAALEEDVDVVGLSILSGAHVPLTRRLVAALGAAGGAGIQVVVGGTIASAEEEAELRAIGVTDVFVPGTPLPEVVDRVRRAAQARPAGHAEASR